MRRILLPLLALLALTPAVQAVGDIDPDSPPPYRVLSPAQECDENGCYVKVCLQERCFQLGLPTAVCLSVTNVPRSFTVGVGNPTRAGGCIYKYDFVLP